MSARKRKPIALTEAERRKVDAHLVTIYRSLDRHRDDTLVALRRIEQLLGIDDDETEAADAPQVS